MAPTLVQRLKSTLVDLIAGPVSRSYHATLIARRVVQLYDNDGNGNMLINGERELLRRVVALRPDGVVFDVGANLGDWSAEAIAAGFHGTLVLVDPLPRNVAALRRRFAASKNVVVVEHALSDTEGETSFFSNVDETQSGTDSLFDMRKIGYDSSIQVVNVTKTTVTNLASNMGITTIDLLKVDVEGGELFVLRGAADMLSTGAIRFIQLEFGHAARAAKVYLHDIVELATTHSYNVFVIKPRGIMPLHFSPFAENRYSYINLLLARPGSVERAKLPVLRR